MMGSFPLTAAGQRRIHTGFPLRFLTGARNTDGHKILWLLEMVNPICWSVTTFFGDGVRRRGAHNCAQSSLLARRMLEWHGASGWGDEWIGRAGLINGANRPCWP